MKGEELATRRRLRQAVEKFPGLHLRELARQTGSSEALADYHLTALVAEGWLEERESEGFRRFYATNVPAPDEEDRRLMGLLRQAVPFQIALHLLEKGPAKQRDLVEVLGSAKSTVSYHVSRLLEARFLVETPDGLVALQEPKRVRDLLIRWTPPSNFTQRFSDLWITFFESARQTKPPKNR